ncbi:MAG: M23 family metallopeptidase [Clostridia bacterium]|nr:M23 family metallopeptidase [Clostridia bacterium]
MEKRKWTDHVRSLYLRYDRMMEKQGFYVVLAVCVVIIAVSAILTFCQRREAQIPVVVEDAAAAGGSQQAQTLEEAMTENRITVQPTTLPTEPPLVFTQPVSGVTIRLFSADEPQYFAASNTWQVHTGIDLQTDYGAPVAAAAPGKVTFAGEYGAMGLCVEIAHGNGYGTVYAGLAEAGFVRAGDPVQAGQTIGLAGTGLLCESNDGAHLHFEVRRDGRPVDPLLAFLGLDGM